MDGPLELLLEPLRYGFLQRALLASVLVGATCAALGVHVVLRRMSFLGDAVAHTALPGLVVAYLNGWSLFLGALVAALLAALGIGVLSRGQRLREDAAIGVLFSGMLALGVVLVSRAKSYRDFHHMLFGNVLGVTTSDLAGIAAASLVTAAALVLLRKELVLTTVDPTHARVIGLSPDRVRGLLLVLLALAVVTGIQAVGVVLTTALLVTPAATASLLTKRLARMTLVAIAVAVGGSVVGIYASYYLAISGGGAIVLACTLAFTVALLATSLRRRP